MSAAVNHAQMALTNETAAEDEIQHREYDEAGWRAARAEVAQVYALLAVSHRLAQLVEILGEGSTK